MSEQQIKLHKQVHEFLKRHPIGVLSTASIDNQPWGSAIFFYVDEHFNFYFVTRANTHKYHNVQANPQAAITIAHGASQTTVQAAGKLSEVPAEDYMNIIFDKLASVRPGSDGGWAPPIAKIHEGNYIPLKLTPTKLQYANYSQNKSDPRADYIQTII